MWVFVQVENLNWVDWGKEEESCTLPAWIVLWQWKPKSDSSNCSLEIQPLSRVLCYVSYVYVDCAFD